jgi:flagellar assembly protein FliH
MSSSKPGAGFRNVPPPAGTKPAHAYARFIPREELASFAAWNPGSLSGEEPVAAPAAPAEPQRSAEEIVGEQLRAARQGGYHDGYRDGLAALESFKQSFATQATAQVGALMQSYATQIDALQQDMARALAASAIALARQIVRSELALRPEAVSAVATEALEALMLSARHVTVRVHPDDQPLVEQGAGELLDARGARLVADPSVTRGGCLVESDMGIVDASIESRWRRAAAALGSEQPYRPEADA